MTNDCQPIDPCYFRSVRGFSFAEVFDRTQSANLPPANLKDLSVPQNQYAARQRRPSRNPLPVNAQA